MPAAREHGLSPRLLLMLEIHNGRHTRLRSLAERLEVTVQAVSEALRRLTAEGLVHSEGGIWKPTPKGTEWLHQNFLGLRRFVEDAVGRLRIINECIAIADGPIHAGDEVGLHMSGGHLRARRGAKERSRGVAANRVAKGGLVTVERLEGVVELVPGTVRVVAHAPFPDRKALAQLRREARGWDGALTAVHDTTSRALGLRLGRRVDLEFAPIEAATDAARRGLDVVYLAPRSEAPAVLAALASAKDAEGSPIKLRSVEI